MTANLRALFRPSRRIPGVLQLAAAASSHIISDWLFIIHPTFRRYVIWSTDSTVKESVQ
jgi:hypothetical protein